MTQLPGILVCSRALEEVVDHSNYCELVLPAVSSKRISSLKRSLAGQYKARAWEWFALSTISTHTSAATAIPYLFAVAPSQCYISPLHGVPACASCGDLRRVKDSAVGDDVRETLAARKSINYLFERSNRCRDFFQLSSKHMAPVYITLISGFVVILFRVSVWVSSSTSGKTVLASPASVEFAADWWTTRVRPDMALSVLRQYIELVAAASREGFVSADATLFSMFLLFASGGEYNHPVLVWPACLTWYFCDDKHIVPPCSLNSVDSCTFTMLAFKKRATMRTGNPAQLPSLNHRKRKKPGASSKAYERAVHLSKSLLSDDYKDVSTRASHVDLGIEDSISATLFIERCSEPNRSLVLLSVKSIALEHLSQFAVSVAALVLNGFTEVARKPTAVALSSGPLPAVCVADVRCNLRHIFKTLTPAAAVYEPLHLFACGHIAAAAGAVIVAPNVDAVYAIVKDAVRCSATQEIVLFAENIFGCSRKERTLV